MKPKKTFRDFILVFPVTKENLLHNFATNPHVGWAYHDKIQLHAGFKRKADAQAAAVKQFGPIDWTPDVGQAIRGEYGPHYTANEWLARHETSRA